MPLKGLGRLDRAIKVQEKALNDKVRGEIITTYDNVGTQTPKDEGTLSRAWRVGDSDNPSSSTAQVLKWVLGKKIYFVNPMPYAVPAEYGLYTNKPETPKTIGGYSKQAKKGFLRTNLVKLRQALRQL